MMSADSVEPKLISREIIVEEFQHVITVPQHYRQIVGQTGG